MMNTVAQFNRRASKAMSAVTDSPFSVRKAIASSCLVATAALFGAYIAFLFGTTVAAAEYRTVSAHAAEMVAAIGEREGEYVRLLTAIDTKAALDRGFRPADPSFVVHAPLATSFTLRNAW